MTNIVIFVVVLVSSARFVKPCSYLTLLPLTLPGALQPDSIGLENVDGHEDGRLRCAGDRALTSFVGVGFHVFVTKGLQGLGLSGVRVQDVWCGGGALDSSVRDLGVIVLVLVVVVVLPVAFFLRPLVVVRFHIIVLVFCRVCRCERCI